MRTRAFALLLSTTIPLSLLSGCNNDSDGPGTPDPNALIPSPLYEPQTCVAADRRTVACRVDVSGAVVDFATLTTISSGAEVKVNTAWDTIPMSPELCPALATIPSDLGVFGASDVRCDDVTTQPILALLVDDAPGQPDRLAPTIADRRLTCADDPQHTYGIACDPLDMDVAVPSSALAAAWRAELATGGVALAQTRGLVIYRFNEVDGSPAAGVSPRGQAVVVDAAGHITASPIHTLVPGAEVRFLADDRATLLPGDTQVTGASGLAIIALPSEIAFIGANRGATTWNDVGVMLRDGWFFLEDARAAR